MSLVPCAFVRRAQIQSSAIPYRNYVTRFNMSYIPRYFPNTKAMQKVLRGQILINQTSVELSDLDKELLCVGLNFVHPPTSGLGLAESTSDAFQRWARSVDIDIHLAHTTFSKSKTGWLKETIKSTWDPPRGTWREDPAVKEAIWKLKLSLTPQLGLRPENRVVSLAIARLRDNTGIHILKADKGRTTVIWSAADYDAEALRQLGDPTTYLEMDEATYDTRLESLVHDCQNHALTLHDLKCISTRELEAMLDVKPNKGSAFYLLPKIHKSPNPFGGFPGRPIVATFTNPVHLIDKYLTSLTAVLLPLIPGSLRDTPDLISRLQSSFDPPLSKSAVIVTADVNSLYPCIPWNEGIDASVAFYQEHLSTLKSHATANNMPEPPPVMVFADLLRFVLQNSYIHFKNRKFFKQLSGTAMGMCISVFFANAYMYSITKQHIHSPPSKVRLFLRYIDDIIVIFDDATDEEVAEFFSTISNGHITYTVDKVGTSQNFLDLTVSIDKTLNSVFYAPFWKPTSSGSYIHPDTCHPGHVMSAIPFSQFLRLRRNSSSTEIFLTAAKRLTRDFKLSGYMKWEIAEAQKRALAADPNGLALLPTAIPIRPQKDNNDRYLIVPYHHDIDYIAAKRRLIEVQDAAANHYLASDVKIFDQIVSRKSSIVNSVLPNTGSNFTRLVKQGPPTKRARHQ